MKKISAIFFLLIFFLNNTNSSFTNEIDIYKKIDLFSEVLEKINKEYVDKVNQSDVMDAAINGVLQSLESFPSILQFKIPLSFISS